MNCMIMTIVNSGLNEKRTKNSEKNTKIDWAKGTNSDVQESNEKCIHIKDWNVEVIYYFEGTERLEINRYKKHAVDILTVLQIKLNMKTSTKLQTDIS